MPPSVHFPATPTRKVPDARVGEVEGEYCPGEFSVNARGRVKLIGAAQRIIRGAWLLSSVVVVDGAETLRAVLEDVYAALGLEWDPGTVGAVAEEAPGVGVDRHVADPPGRPERHGIGDAGDPIMLARYDHTAAGAGPAVLQRGRLAGPHPRPGHHGLHGLHVAGHGRADDESPGAHCCHAVQDGGSAVSRSTRFRPGRRRKVPGRRRDPAARSDTTASGRAGRPGPERSGR